MNPRCLRGLLPLLLLLPAGGVAASATTPTDSLLAAARVAAGEDRHGDSIDLYRRAGRDSTVRELVAVDLARQLTWAGRMDESMAELEWYLARHPDDAPARLHFALNDSWSGRTEQALAEYRKVLAAAPGNRDAALGEARMLGWLGRLDASEEIYARLERRDPGNLEARLGRAQIANWKAESRRAWRLYDATLAVDPKNRDAREGRALAQSWIGRTDLALATLSRMESDGLATEGSRRLAGTIRREMRPQPGLRFDFFEDSQDYRLRAVRQDVALRPGPLLELRPWVSRKEESRPGDFDVEEFWAGLGLSWRLSTALTLSGGAGVLPSPDPGTDYAPVTGEAYFGIQPSDRTRVTLAWSRSLYTFLNRAPAVPRVDKLAGNSFGFVLSRQIDHRTSVTANYDYSLYILAGDTTAHFRHHGRVRLNREILAGPPKLSVEGSFLQIGFNRWAPIGVWTPERFQSAQAGLNLEWKIVPAVTLSGGLQGGTQREQEKDAGGTLRGDWDAFGGFTGLLSARAGGLDFFAGGGRANSTFETGRGYRRTYLYAGLSWRF